MPHRNNVLARLPRPTTKSYQAAIKKIVLDLQAGHSLNDIELAERVGCSKGTIKNAREQNGCLNGVTLANLEYEFGPAAIDPFMALGGSRSVPLCHGADAGHAILDISAALHHLIKTQHRDSPGGTDTLPVELKPILADLIHARTALDALIEQAAEA